MSVTIKEIAEKAGVARSVVSAVLNDNYKYVRVSQEKQERIRSLVRELNYSPSAAARSITTKKTGIINFLIPSYDYVGHADNARFIKGMNAVLSAEGYRISFTSLADERDEEKYLKNMIADVVVLSYWGGAEDDLVNRLAGFDLPLLVVRSRCQRSDVSNLFFNIEDASYLLTTHLIGKGHRHICYTVGWQGDLMHQEARLGIERAVKEQAGAELTWLPIALDRSITDGNEQSYLVGRKAVDEIVRQNIGCTALITTADTVARGAIDRAKDTGLSLHEGLEVTGRDNSYISRTADPPFSTIDRNAETAGERAGEILLELVNDPHKVIIEKQSMTAILR